MIDDTETLAMTTEEEPAATEEEEPSGPVLSRRDIEVLAQRLGWRPRSRWKEEPGKQFVDAPQYLQNADTTKRRLEVERTERARERQQYEVRAADFERRLNAQAKLQARNLELQKQALLEKFEDEKRQALGIEDPVQRQRAYDATARRERDAFTKVVEHEREFTKDTQPQQQPPAAIPAELQQWGLKNPWIQYVPPEIKQEAVAVMAEIESRDPDSSLTEKLDEVTEVIRNRHAAWFPPKATNGSNGRVANVSAVEGGASSGLSRGSANSRVKGFKDLPNEAKTEFNKMVAEGYMKPARGETPETARPRLEKAYAQAYWEDYGE
jgi:hypothetical protein